MCQFDEHAFGRRGGGQWHLGGGGGAPPPPGTPPPATPWHPPMAFQLKLTLPLSPRIPLTLPIICLFRKSPVGGILIFLLFYHRVILNIKLIWYSIVGYRSSFTLPSKFNKSSVIILINFLSCNWPGLLHCLKPVNYTTVQEVYNSGSDPTKLCCVWKWRYCSTQTVVSKSGDVPNKYAMLASYRLHE